MSLTDQINQDIKAAMLAREKDKLEALRSIKAALLVEMTKGTEHELAEDVELKLLMRLQKQRNESAEIYREQGRDDLAEVEETQAGIIGNYLPKQMSEEEVTAVLKEIISKTGATSMADMGKVMGAATSQLAGKADGKMISGIVRKLLA